MVSYSSLLAGVGGWFVLKQIGNPLHPQIPASAGKCPPWEKFWKIAQNSYVSESITK